MWLYVYLILGLLCALPPLLLLVSLIPVLALVSLPALACFLQATKTQIRTESPSKIEEKDSKSPEWPTEGPAPYHVVITGGSQGIGLALAHECVRSSSKNQRQQHQHPIDRITLLARNQSRLDQAKAELQEELRRLASEPGNKSKNPLGPTMEIDTFSCDVTDAQALKDAATTLCLTHAEHRRLVFCCAGQAQPARFLESTTRQLEQQIQLNYLGTVYTAHAFLPHMQRGGGTLCLTSSMAGLLGVYGYTGYAPAKFALRGFAEALHQELLYASHGPQKIHIQVYFPPDVDTPGFAQENLTKPEETRRISETSDLFTPQQIAKRMLQEATRPSPRLYVYFNLDGFLLSTLASGFAPVTTLVDGLAQVAGMNLLKWVSIIYLQYFYYIFRQCSKERETNTKTADDKNEKAD